MGDMETGGVNFCPSEHTLSGKGNRISTSPIQLSLFTGDVVLDVVLKVLEGS